MCVLVGGIYVRRKVRIRERYILGVGKDVLFSEVSSLRG